MLVECGISEQLSAANHNYYSPFIHAVAKQYAPINWRSHGTSSRLLNWIITYYVKVPVRVPGTSIVYRKLESKHNLKIQFLKWSKMVIPIRALHMLCAIPSFRWNSYQRVNKNLLPFSSRVQKPTSSADKITVYLYFVLNLL